MHRSQNLAAGSSALILPELQLGDQVAIIAATISMVFELVLQRNRQNGVPRKTIEMVAGCRGGR